MSEIVNGVLQQVLEADPNLTDMQKSAITQWVAAAVGAAVGGGTGAAAAECFWAGPIQLLIQISCEMRRANI